MSSTSTGGVSEETQELLARVAELQKEKWALEEKVRMIGLDRVTWMPNKTVCLCVCVCVCMC